MRKQHISGSDIILSFVTEFVIPRNSLPKKAAQINQLRTGKCWHFLFGEQNRKWRHFRLHHSVQHPEKPPFWENGTIQSFTGRKMLALPVWRAKQEVRPFWTSPLRSASLDTPFLRKWHRSSNKWQENADTSVFGPFWLLEVLPFSPFALKMDSQTHRHQFCMVYYNSWHERGYNSYQIGEAVMKIGGFEVAVSQSWSAWPQLW